MTDENDIGRRDNEVCDAPGCGGFAPFGYGASDWKGKPGKWFCKAHRYLGERYLGKINDAQVAAIEDGENHAKTPDQPGLF